MSSIGKPTIIFFFLCYSLFSWQDVNRNGLWLLGHWCTLAPVLLWRAKTLYLWILQAEFSQRVTLPKYSVPKIFAGIFQTVESAPQKVLPVTQETRFLVSRRPLNSMYWKRIQGELSLWAGVGGGCYNFCDSPNSYTFDKRELIMFNYPRTVTHHATVQYNI